MNKSDWCAAQWQAHIEKMPAYEERKEALQEVPAAMRLQVRHHLITVMSLKKYHAGLVRAKKK